MTNQEPDSTTTTDGQQPARALILVDLQNDFMPGGPLGVDDGDAVVAVANALMPRFDLVVATQDWHPAGHESFASAHPGRAPGEQINLHGLSQILWPDHCVQGTHGAAFVEPLERGAIDAVFRKGADPQVDSYSAFFDNGRRRDTGLTAWLRERRVGEVYVLGLATDYCVKWTALDAAKQGLSTRVVRDGVRAVNLEPEDGAKAQLEMADAGVQFVHSDDIAHRGASTS